MAYKIKGQIDGLGAVLAKLKQLPKKVAAKAIKAGVSQAGKLLLWAAKSRAPRQTGLLRRSLGRKVKVFRNTGKVVAIVGPRVGFREEVVRDGKTMISNPTRYAHLVELGTARTQRKPFLKPAFKQQREAMMKAIADAIEAAIKEM